MISMISRHGKARKKNNIIRAAAVLTAALILITTFAGCFGGKDDGIVRVMQFNIKVGNAESVAPRVSGLKKLIEERDPDIIGFQEVTTAWREQLDKKVLTKKWAGVGELRREGEEATPVYYRKDKFKLLDSGTFWLSPSPDVPASSFEGANYPRIASWAKLQNKKTGYVFVHVNTHLDHNGDNDSATAREIRTAQTEVLLRFIDSLGDVPVIMTGDFNQAMSSSKGNFYKPYKLIVGMDELSLADGSTVKMNFLNTRLTAKQTVDGDRIATMVKSYDESSTSYDPAKQPIDYVFYTEGDYEALLYSTFMPLVDGVEVSDHLGLYCELKISP